VREPNYLQARHTDRSAHKFGKIWPTAAEVPEGFLGQSVVLVFSNVEKEAPQPFTPISCSANPVHVVVSSAKSTRSSHAWGRSSDSTVTGNPSDDAHINLSPTINRNGVPRRIR
jgi:hypothetical protein